MNISIFLKTSRCVLSILAFSALLGLSLSAPTYAAAAAPVRPMSFLRALIDGAVASHAQKVVIPPGIYRGGPALGSPIILPIQHAQNLRIIANGVEMVCTTRTRAVFLHDCQNVTLEGLTIDYDPLTFTQGKVTAIAPDGNSLDITLDDGYPRQPFARIMLVDPKTHFIAAKMPFFWGSTSAMVGPNVVRVTLNNIGKSAQVGMLATLSDGSQPGGIPHALTIENCRGGMVLDGVTVFCAPGMGIIDANGAGGTKMLHLRIVPGPPPPGGTQPRLLTTSWDGILTNMLAHGDDVEDCTIQDCGDDTWSDASSPLLVLQGVGTQLVLAGNVDLAPGDHLRQSLASGPITVVSVQRVPLAQAHLDPATVQHLAHPAQYSLWQTNHDTVQIVTTAQSAALTTGDSVYAPEHQGNGFVFRDNQVHSQGRILIKASDGVIEGNTIIGGHNIAVIPEIPAHGAFGIQNLVFKNNTIVDAEATNAMPWSAQDGALCVVSNDPATTHNQIAPAGSFQNITITGNTFENTSAANLWLAGIRGLTITDNHFLRPDCQPLTTSGTSYGVDNAAVICLRRCDRVTLSGNRVRSPGPYEKTLVSLNATDTHVKTVDGGVRLVSSAPTVKSR